MREQLIALRILHVTLMFASSIFLYQFSQWDDGLWIPISVLAISGPFRPGMTLHKAKQRLLGSLVGLGLSLGVWLLLYANNNLLVPIALLLMYGVAFTLLNNYSYFIAIVSMLLCLNFDYMNLAFNNEVSYLLNRGMCVLAGVSLCLFFEYFIFQRYYVNATAMVNHERLDALLFATWQQLQPTHEKIPRSTVDSCLSNLLVELRELAELSESCRHGFSSQQQTLALARTYEVKLHALCTWISASGFNCWLDSTL